MKITSLIKSKIFSIFSHKILFCSLLLIFASFSLFGVEYKTKSSSSTLSWFDENSWQDIDGNGEGDIPKINGNTEVEIYLYADMVAESSDANDVETIILEFNKSGTNAIHIYFNGHTFDVKNAIKVGSNTTSQVFTSTTGNHGNLYLHGKGNFYVGVLEFGQDAKRVTDWWGNYPENKISLDNGLEFYVNQHVSPYHCMADIYNPEGTKFYLNASGMNLNWYNQCDINFTNEPIPYGPQTFYKITEDGKNPTSQDGKTITFTRGIVLDDKSSVKNSFKYKVQIIEENPTNVATWTLEDTALSSTNGYDNVVELDIGVNTLPKTLKKTTGIVDPGDGIIITFRTPDEKMDMCEIRYIEGELLWTGASSTDILDTGNWSYDEIFSEGVLKEAIIGSGAVNYPEITEDVTVSKLTVKNGARITVVEGGVLTVNDSLIFEGNSKIDASAGTVVFAGSETNQNTSFTAKYPEFSSFGTLEVAENIIFATSSDLHIKTALTNKGTFTAGKVYLEPSENEITITGQSGDSSEVAEKTNIAKLYCENQANKNLKIINAISVGNIYISGKQDTDGNRLSVTGGTIYLENDYEDAKYLVLSDDLPTIKNGYITASKSKVEITDKPAFSAKNWKYDDGVEYPVWKGTKDSDWKNENNWNFYGVPTAATNDYVVISADGHSPIISSEVEIKKLLIQDGANLSLDENGKLTISESLNCAETGNIDASAGTVIFTGKGTVENPSFEANDSTTFGKLLVAENAEFYSESKITAGLLENNGTFTTKSDLHIKNALTNNGTFTANSDLHITNVLTNNGTFSAETVYVEPSETATIIESAEIANQTKIQNLNCADKGGKSLVINGTISVEKISLSGAVNSFLTVKTSDSENSGKIYLGANCDANYLSFEKGKVVSILNYVINVTNSDMTNIKVDVDFKSEFVEKNWRYADQTEFIWTGKNNVKWTDSKNWDFYSVPSDNAQSIIIPNGCANYPILDENINLRNSSLIIKNGDDASINFAEKTVTVKTIENGGEIDFAGSKVTAESITNNGTVRLTGLENITGTITEEGTVCYYKGTGNYSAEFVWGGEYKNLVIEDGFSGTRSGQSGISLQVSDSLAFGDKEPISEKVNNDKDVFSLAGSSLTISYKKDESIVIEATGNHSYNGNLSFSEAVTIKSTNGTVSFLGTENSFKNGLILNAQNSDFENTGNFSSESGAISITAKTFTNAEGKTISAKTGFSCVTTETFTNTGNITTLGFEVDATGDFTNAGTITAGTGDISVTSSSFENNGKLSGTSGTIKAETGNALFSANSEVVFTSDLTVECTNAFTNAGTITAAGNLVINQVVNFTNSGNITAYGVEIVAIGNFKNEGSFISENGDINITSANFENAQSSEFSAKFGKITISATGDFTNTGNITALGVEIGATGDFKNEGSFISENGDISIKSANFEDAQSSEISAKSGKMTISATSDFTNAGTITASGVEIVAIGNFKNEGSFISENGDITITSASFENSQYSELSANSGKITISATGDFTNTGNITAYEVEIVAIGNFKNEGSFISENGDINITSASFENSQYSELSAKSGKMVISATGDFTNSGNFISENGDINITSANFENTQSSELSANSGKMTITATGDFTNAGVISALEVEIGATGDFTNSGTIDSSTGLLKITAKSITTSGKIKANSGEFISTETDILFAENSETTFEVGLTVTSAGNFENCGTISALGVEIVAIGNFKNEGSFISENGDINITSANFENSQSSELSAKSGKMTISATGDFTNAGAITAYGVEIEATGDFTNSGNFISENGDITITSASFENAQSSEISAKSGKMAIIATGDFTNAGKIDSSSELLKITAKSITTSGEINAQSGDFESTEAGIIFGENSENTFEAGLTVTSAGNFENYGAITAFGVEIVATGNFTNSGSFISENGDINITSANFENAQSSEIFANTGKITISATGDFTNAGKIDSSSELLKITAKSITTSGEIKANSGDFESTETDILFTVNSENSFEAGLTITSAGNFENYGAITALGVEIVAIGNFTNSGSFISENGDISIISANFENAQSSEISANSGKMTISATGDFTNSGKIDSSSELLKITAKSITTSGEIKANSGEFISIESDILFGGNSENTFEAGLTVTSAGNFENYGAITAYGIEIDSTGNFTNSGSFISENGDINIKSANFENASLSELSANTGKMTITATGDFSNSGKIDSSSELLKITAKSITTFGEIKANSGEFESTESDILFAENSASTFIAGLTVTSAENFKNEGIITAESGAISITAKTFTNAEGKTISAKTGFTCEITDIFTNAGTIEAGTGDISITASSFENNGKLSGTSGTIKAETGNVLFSANSDAVFTSDLTVECTNAFTNAGVISAYEVEIEATGNFTNSGTIDSSTGLLKITAKTITTSGEINAQSGDFESTEAGIVFGENSENTFEAGLTVTSAGNFENYGNITALGFEIGATGNFTNSGKLISENGDINITSANFENASLSELSANKDFVCNVTESFSNAGIITSASGKVDINTKSFINKNYNLETPAKIKTENGLINVTTSNFENSSDISAYLDFTCAEPEIFTNAGTITSETGKIDVKAQIMENPGSLFAINGKIDIFTELFETTKEIFGKNIDINSQSSIFAGLVKSEAGDIYISSDLLITHPVEFCLGGTLIIGTVKNPKNLVISSLDKNQNATEVKFSQNDDLESIETKVIVSGYAIIFNGNVTLSTNIDIANDFVLLNGITSDENSIYRDSITEIDGLFAYNLFGRGDFDFIDFPSDLPFSIEDNKLTTKNLFHEKYNTHFSIAEGKIISVGKNFYCNGVDLGLNTSAEWFLKIPGNDVATSAFAECYNASIKNCKVAANTNPEDYAWLSTENAKDETGNTNVAFSKAVLSSTEVSTISDNIIFIKFIDELNGKEIKIENSCNEISAWLENFRFNVSGQISEDNPGIQFTGVYENPECTESTDGKGDLSTFYLKYEIPTDGSIDYRWNTDAIGNSYGSEESTDSSGNYKKVIPNIAFERALTASYAGLRDEHKNRLVSVGTDDIGSNPLFTETKDKASPVLIAVTLGQEQHETDASSQHHYDSHNFIDWQFSEPVEFENYPKNGISQIDSVDTSANSENIQATETFGKITNQGNGFVVAGLGSFSSGKITTGSKTGLGEVNAFYRNFALDVDEKGSSYNPKIKPTRLRLSIAGYVEEENPINYKGEIYNNWLGFIDSKNTTIPSGTFTMPSSISTSIIDKRGNRGEAMEQTVSVNDFLNRYDKEKTLYGTWDIDSPVVSSYMKENLTTIEFEEVIPVDFSQSLSTQGLEIHFLDNSSYNQFEGYSNWKWRTKIGWLYKNESTEITLPLDNKGGSRMTFAENKTGGGLRLSSIVDSIEALSCKNLDLEKAMTFTTDFSQSTTYEAFFGKSEDLAFDVPYLSLRFSELSKEFSLNNNYELLYSRHDSQGNPIGFITDLAGNLLYDFTVNSPDKNPPKIFLSIGAVHKDKLYIMFSKKLDWKDSNGNADEGKLRRIVKSLSIFDSKGNDTGLIDYKKGSRTKIVTETEKSTGIEISLTRTISYEELKNLYIGVNVFDSRDELIAGDGDKSKEDSISGEHGNFSMLYDLYENPASKDLKHCLSDFAVNALDVLYAYDGRVADEAILAQGVYGGNQWTVTNFTENKDNSSQIISDKDISIVSKIKDPSSFEKQDKFSMIADISPNLQSTGSDFKIYTDKNPRLWFTDYIKFFSTEPNNSENIEKDNIGSISGKIENIVSGDKNQNITFVLPNHPKNENSLGWGAGNEIQFLFKVFDKDGNPLMVDGNQDGDFEDDVDHPLFAVRLKDENDLTSIDLWSLNIVDILRQKGGVTILNNVINPLNSEECAIEITIPKAGNLTVQVLTLDGNVVKVIQRGRVEEGTYYYKWNGKNISGDSVARGMYFIRVVGPNIEETRKVMVVW